MSVGGDGAIRPELEPPELPASRGWAAGPVAALERALASSSAAHAGAVGGGPAYLAMPARTGYAPQAAAFAPAERGYADGAGLGGAAIAASSSTSAKAAAASGSSASKAAAKSSASKSSTSRSSTSKSSTSKSSSKASRSKSGSAELAFLDDPHVSIEDKLFRFMSLMQQKADAELVDAMKRYEEKKAAADESSPSSGGAKTGSSPGGAPAPEKKESSGGGGGGLFGMLGDALGGLAKTVVSGAESLAKDLGGPLLAAGATAVGLPFLAPVALQIGGPLAKSAVSGLASAVGLDGLGKGSASASAGSSSSATTTSTKTSSSTAKTTSASASKAGAADEGVFDEKLEMLGLQRLVEKQQTMFAALSNVLKAQHDGQMVAVNNIR